MMTKNILSTPKWGLGYNCKLLSKQLLRGWQLTLIIFTLIISINMFYLIKYDRPTIFEIAATIFGLLSALAFLKALILYMGYRIFNTNEFDGSFIVISILLALLLTVSIGAASFLVSSRIGDFPSSEIIWIIPVIFVITSLFLLFTLKVSYWLFKPLSRK